MKKILAASLLALTALVPARFAHAGGGPFIGGFVAGAVVGALARPPVVVARPLPPPRFRGPRRVWVPGGWVVQYRPCGTPYRAWRPGFYRRR